MPDRHELRQQPRAREASIAVPMTLIGLVALLLLIAVPQAQACETQTALRVHIVTCPPYSATGDGTMDDRTALAAADAAATSTGTLVIPKGTYRISADLSLAAALRFSNGAMFAPDAGVVVTINGPFEAGLYRVFTGAGTIRFGAADRTPATRVERISPHWWGAVGDNQRGSADRNTAALQAALDVGGPGARIGLGPGIFWVAAPLSVTSAHLEGAGSTQLFSMWKTQIIGDVPGPLVDLSGTGGSVTHLHFNNVNQAGTGIRAANLAHARIESVWVDSALIGIDVGDNSFSLSIRDCNVTGPGGTVPNSVGINISSHSNLDRVDVTAFQNGIRYSGEGTGVTHGARLERNGTALVLGKNRANTNRAAAETVIAGVTMEANDIGIEIWTLGRALLAGIFMHGGPSAPSGQAQYAIRHIGDMKDVVFSGIQTSSTHSLAAVKIEPGSSGERIIMQAMHMRTNFGGTSIDWDIPASWLASGAISFRQTNSGYDGP
jgi:hypothetical protein